MNTIFTNYLFSKHYFVSGQNSKDASFETLFSLANLFNIRIVSGQALAEPETVTTQITFQLVEQDGQWWAVPDQAMLDILSGGLS